MFITQNYNFLTYYFLSIHINIKFPAFLLIKFLLKLLVKYQGPESPDKLISGEVVELILTNFEGQLTRPEGCVVLLKRC